MGRMTKHAILHRMVLPGHICPYGLKAKHLLEQLQSSGILDRTGETFAHLKDTAVELGPAAPATADGRAALLAEAATIAYAAGARPAASASKLARTLGL